MNMETLKAERRENRGTRAARRLRKTGMLPGIVYGHKQDPLAISMDQHAVGQLLAHGTHVVNLDVGGRKEPCLLRDVQYDHLGIAPLHVDLTRIDLEERVHVKVPLEIKGKAVGLGQGGALEQQLIDLEVNCRAVDIPESIRVNVAELGINGTIHVKELELPAGVEAIPDGETIVVLCREVTLHVEAEETAEAEAKAAEPEVLAKGKGESEAESESKGK
ncbi:MAG: 50S ribosomal protein L25 [Phycisphaerae bacterium]